MKPDIVIYLAIAVGLLAAWNSNWVVRITIIISSIIYLFVNLFFFNLVRNASTHGNTIHGWYSKYNRYEKLLAWLWFIIFPIIVAFIAYWFDSLYKRYRKKTNAK
jgi:hypothetical protein